MRKFCPRLLSDVAKPGLYWSGRSRNTQGILLPSDGWRELLCYGPQTRWAFSNFDPIFGISAYPPKIWAETVPAAVFPDRGACDAEASPSP